MTRSRKKAPVIGISTSTSEKADKVAAHRKERRKVHVTLKTTGDQDALPLRNEVSNVWAYAKDGKRYNPSWLKPKHLRK